MADEQHSDLPTGTDAPPEALRAVDALLGRAPRSEAPNAPFADLAELDELRTALEAEREAHRRTAADFANFRRRTTEERERDAGAAASDLLLRLLGVIDDLDRAFPEAPVEILNHPWYAGLTVIRRNLDALLEREGVTPVEALGRPFDPREHEAIARVDAPGVPADEVVAEHRRGYRLRSRLLRPALVSVAAGE
jgi:molecular chaperone GrpE